MSSREIAPPIPKIAFPSEGVDIERISNRFWSKVTKGEHCWEWNGCISSAGYGSFGCRWGIGRDRKGRILMAHRVSFWLTYGNPGDSCVLHKCDNRKCVRPDHLFLGTHQDNSIDMVRKGRGGQPKGEDHPRSKLTSL